MVNLSTVRDIFRRFPNCSVIAKKNGFFTIKAFQDLYYLSIKDVEEYLSVKTQLKNPLETSVYFPTYYEQAVTVGTMRSSRLFYDNDLIELKSHDGVTNISVGYITSLFCLNLIDRDDVPFNIRRYIRPGYSPRGEKSKPGLGNMFRIRSVRITTSPDVPYSCDQKYLLRCCESGLFNLAYSSGTSIGLSQSWERSYYWLRNKRHEAAQFPLRLYNSELTAFYHLAMGSESLILSYLALYKILEFFFTSSSEQDLHQRVKEKLIQPDFHHTKAGKLRDLVSVIRKYDQKMDECKMLQTVLSHYIDKADMRIWIEQFESDQGKHYSCDQILFGDGFKVDMSDDQLLFSIAKRIYHIRNALVHNKEGEILDLPRFSGHRKGYNMKTLEVSDAKERPDALQSGVQA